MHYKVLVGFLVGLLFIVGFYYGVFKGVQWVYYQVDWGGVASDIGSTAAKVKNGYDDTRENGS
tara:strand:- start:1129 stop:1317 length:189 start_codon:yes stop_codon:yes gene_type:complete